MNLIYTLEELQMIAHKRLIAIEILEEEIKQLKETIKELERR